MRENGALDLDSTIFERKPFGLAVWVGFGLLEIERGGHGSQRMNRHGASFSVFSEALFQDIATIRIFFRVSTIQNAVLFAVSCPGSSDDGRLLESCNDCYLWRRDRGLWRAGDASRSVVAVVSSVRNGAVPRPAASAVHATGLAQLGPSLPELDPSAPRRPTVSFIRADSRRIFSRADGGVRQAHCYRRPCGGSPSPHGARDLRQSQSSTARSGRERLHISHDRRRPARVHVLADISQ